MNLQQEATCVSCSAELEEDDPYPYCLACKSS